LLLLCRDLLLREAVGDFPSLLHNTLIVLIPRPDGGVRSIALFRALVRVWCRHRVSSVRERDRTRGVHLAFNVSHRRATTDGVWRALVRGEVIKGSHAHALALIWDLLKCHEHVLHQCSCWITVLDIAIVPYPLSVASPIALYAAYCSPFLSSTGHSCWLW